MKIKYKFNKDKLFFTSDLHLFHENIIEYCNRPFSSIDEMNRKLIHNWNDIVGVDDDIIVDGDFMFTSNLKKIEETINILNGRIWLVLGNHDYKSNFERKSVSELFEGRVYDAMDIKVHDDELDDDYMKIHISHYPCEFWTRGAIHLYGHIHSGPNSTGDEICQYKPMRYDVGVDNNNYKPISYHEIKTTITKRLIGYSKK